MQTIQRPVVVGIDGPADTVAAAIRLGLWEAARRHTTLRLVGAYDTAPPGHPDLDAGKFVRRFAEELAASANDGRPEPGVESVVYHDNAAHALADGGSDAAMIIVAGDARVHHGAIPGGQVAADVVAHATVPVIVIPPLRDPRGIGCRVVVGVDGSTGSADALGFAFDEAAARGATLHAVSVWDRAARHGFRPLGFLGELGPQHEAAARALDEALAPWIEKHPDVPVMRDAVRHSSPLQALCQAAAGAELLVVGARGCGGFASHVIGSVSAGLVHYCPTPVAVVHTPGGVR